MSWWLGKSRDAFSKEIATRFAVNKADQKDREYRTTQDRQTHARKGGQKRAHQHGVNIKLRGVA